MTPGGNGQGLFLAAQETEVSCRFEGGQAATNFGT